ncbi:MAG TPA: inositol monophosphatase family protein [Candidatus Paceibacterota bacterium]|nr:inositol monophosphatase family protein [Verrucomicrobiota bacterium]HSA10951.1 inositol monophosphatase family protein [Candidatus Paceibacterota bacterium]
MNLQQAQSTAIRAAKAVGATLRRELNSIKRTQAVTQHDIKLELDVQSQKLIEKTLSRAFPQVALLGEEGDTGRADAKYRWVVDPIDGTVNFTYGIPHACVSIALQQRATSPGAASYEDGYQTLLGVVYEPFCDELWTAIRSQAARLNGRTIQVSRRPKLAEAVVSLGFTKSRESLDAMLPYFNRLVHRVRKIRMMGSAALGLTYVACGRFDAYLECEISLWDIAAGGLIIESAGGEFWHRPIPGRHKYYVIASNGLLRRSLRVPR